MSIDRIISKFFARGKDIFVIITLKRQVNREEGGGQEESLITVDNTKFPIRSRANYGDKSNFRSRRVLNKNDSMKKNPPLVSVHNIILPTIAIISSPRFFLVTASLASISPCREFNRRLRGLHWKGR